MRQKNLGLRCPCIKKTKLQILQKQYFCGGKGCIHSKLGHNFPKVNEKPVIISEQNCDTAFSSFSTKSYVNRKGPLLQKLSKFLVGENNTTVKNCNLFVENIFCNSRKPKILVIGSGELGAGTEKLYSLSEVEIVGVDVYESPLVDIVCDAHYLPFADLHFDGVWIQAVLEHVVEPHVVVSEIYRVLRPDGIVYAETPFMQQVHEGRYDFTRYTTLGHRYLFKKFEMIDFGGNKGAEVVLAWSIKYFILSLFRSVIFAKAIGVLSRILLRPFSMLMSTASFYDSSSGVYFMGRKREKFELSHKELIKLYKGQL